MGNHGKTVEVANVTPCHKAWPQSQPHKQEVSSHGHMIAVNAVPVGDSNGTRYVRKINYLYLHKHFGFIKCKELKQQYGMDKFLSDQEAGFFASGNMVSFMVTLNSEGYPQARSLQAVLYVAGTATITDAKAFTPTTMHKDEI